MQTAQNYAASKLERGMWTVSAEADNATATATRSATTGQAANQKHYVSAVSASFSSTVSGVMTLTIKSGSTTMWKRHFTQEYDLDFRRPLICDPGTALNVELTASGTGGTVGVVNVSGYTDK